MPNQAIAHRLAHKLQEGFLHPGDESRGVPPTPILLPFKPRAGQPKEMSELMIKTSELLAECIVAAIEEDHDIVPQMEVKTLRKAAGEVPDGPQVMPVHCRCDTKLDRPLAVLSVTLPDRFVIDGGTFLRGTRKLDPACPHRPTDRSELDELRQRIRATMDKFPTKTLSHKVRKIISDAMEL